ncbi:MAG: aldo/keto reductase [Coraliomargarita sp.]
MAYRRFGKTNRWLSTITLGGMRYHDGWSEPRDQPSTKMVDQCAEIVSRAFEQGVNHIETAYGYGKSEHCHGIALNDVLGWKRDSYNLMTKGAADTADEMRQLVEKQLQALKTDRIDLYGWHGINNAAKLATATASGGPVEELLKMKDEGIIGDVGFSTHGPLEVIIDAIATDLFSFVNLHYYYFMQRNRGAVDYAAAKGLGVFIISPNDKGGKLYEPSTKLTKLCAPLTPIQFNARWCLQNPCIHTLSFGLSEPEHVKEMSGIFPFSVPLSLDDQKITQRMNAAQLDAPESAWEGYEMLGDPSGINIPEVLRMRRMWKCYDQTSFGDMRYNMFEDKGDWFPGCFATPEAVEKVDTTRTISNLDAKQLLNETHAKFYKPKQDGEG